MSYGRRRLAVLLMSLLVAVPVAAQTASVCEDLRGQLLDTRRVIGNTPQVRQYANALARQNILIRKIRNDLRSYGCSTGSITVYGGQNQDICYQIKEALTDAETERNMILEDRNRMMARGQDDGNDRERIMAALDENGCFAAQQPLQAATEPRDNSLLPLSPDEFDAPLRDTQSYPDPSMETGGLRTLCVRTCDGAFFPISSNASPLDFRRQAGVCERMCPGTETELFYHSLANQESADMISASTGKPYRDMPTAFAYRSATPASRSPSCSCNMASYQDAMKQQELAHTPKAEQPYSSITDIKSPAGDNPAETSKAAPPDVPAPFVPDVPERAYDPNEKVRVIGPQFLPSETSRIDLKNPALSGAQPSQ